MSDESADMPDQPGQMHLRSITMKGFKSFPDRTRLEFSRGVSVIVGPNGSGKSNVADAVLWALGEQSPLAVRGQAMQDVIFSGGPGVPSRSAAEVELVIDDCGPEPRTAFSELSITRRLDRSGEGEYRLNGARCRLMDVLEALSDTGLGKELQSVVSQGRVEAVISSSPGERRLLVEEAAGLGKHRKRRRRAELKLERTEDNLGRVLDVEREARARLGPLKRQAEAAALHERLERQSLEARLELARDDVRAARERLAAAESEAMAAGARRDRGERRLAAVRARREAAERAFAEHGRAREALSGRLFAATTAADRVEMRLDRARELARAAGDQAGALRGELGRVDSLDRMGDATRTDGDAAAAAEADRGDRPPDRDPPAADRIARLEAELAALDEARVESLDPELLRLRAERERCERAVPALEQALSERRAELAAAEAKLASARDACRAADAALGEARSRSGRARAELEAVVHLARASATAPAAGGALAEHLRVEPGYELALAAALGPLLRAGIAASVDEGSALLDSSHGQASVVIDRLPPPPGPPPAPLSGAERLLERVRPTPEAARAADRLLADAWVVDALDALPDDFPGIAVTRSGRALVGRRGELRQAATGADERLLERLSRRGELAAAAEESARRQEAAERDAGAAAAEIERGQAARDRAIQALHAAILELERGREVTRAAERAVARREEWAGEPPAIRRAELAAELRVERRMAERADREREERRRRGERIRARVARAEELRRSAEHVVPALEAALAALAAHRAGLSEELRADEAAGVRTGQELRACAHQEAEAQGELRAGGEVVTAAEVRLQQARDAAAAAERGLAGIAGRLGGNSAAPVHAGQDQVEAPPGALPPPQPPLSADDRAELEARVGRLARRRELLGPINPLAGAEYGEAVGRVEELEAQREDLESALSELRGVIRDTDRRIREGFEHTFEATARNFREVVDELFPGGRGRLRLVAAEGPRPVLGGEGPEEAADPEATDHAGGGAKAPDDAAEPGIEVEVTPAGKSTRRLSLMSGGERALVALAFLFSVFLARPSPFYVLDEVEAALDDPNIDRFLRLVRRCAQRAQFIVVTHQKRTMEAADALYGVSMGSDGVSKVVSRRLAGVSAAAGGASDAAAAA